MFVSPTVVLSQTVDDLVVKGKEFLCKTAGYGCPESIDWEDLVELTVDSTRMYCGITHLFILIKDKKFIFLG